MKKNLLIVFAKNKLYGNVKTRLAKTVGDQAAYEVYSRLLSITEKQSCGISNGTVEVHYSNHIDNSIWFGCNRFIQEGNNLGDRMRNAFLSAFNRGFDNVIGIGADLPEITSQIIEEAFDKLGENDFVFGPAEDGGYYLIGMHQSKGMYVFDDKPWSTDQLYEITKAEIGENEHIMFELETLNDIDTVDDLRKSSISEEFKSLLDNL